MNRPYYQQVVSWVRKRGRGLIVYAKGEASAVAVAGGRDRNMRGDFAGDEYLWSTVERRIVDSIRSSTEGV